MSDQPPRDRVTPSLPQAADDSFSLRPQGTGSASQLDHTPREFVIRTVHSASGLPYAPFIVRATSEAAARKLCQRTYLVLESVVPYAEQAGVEKPRVLSFGPPISDKDFERDYGNRPADSTPANPGTPLLFGLGGLLMCGPLGAAVGAWLGRSHDEPRRD